MDGQTLCPEWDRGNQGEDRRTLYPDEDRETGSKHHVSGLLIRIEHCKYVMLCNVTQKHCWPLLKGGFSASLINQNLKHNGSSKH